ncbi:MAG: type II toxin-antitoxin system RelE/ParE family toxin [Gammaproteobacteria bacterium]|nr:type II toxin-antitoxin system RelE/ParE family toxin [Gammaproteobacteria bacterium]
MAPTEVLLLEEAAADIENGKRFYERRQRGLGEYFRDSLLSDLESLVVYGGVHQKEFGLYRMLSKRFPYAVYYELNAHTAYVIAVLPMRRAPEWIKSSLEGRS